MTKVTGKNTTSSENNYFKCIQNIKTQHHFICISSKYNLESDNCIKAIRYWVISERCSKIGEENVAILLPKHGSGPLLWSKKTLNKWFVGFKMQILYVLQ